MERPYIAVPIGDPAGIGPEITAKAHMDPVVFCDARCVVIGDKRVLERTIEKNGLPLTVRTIQAPGDGDYRRGILNLIDLSNIDISRFEEGRADGMCGRAAYEYIEKSIDLALSGQAAAVATAPINKEALHAGGVPYIDHTEIFAALTHTPDPLTMFEVRGMRIFFLSRHVSLQRACEMVRKDRIKDYVRRCFGVLKQLGAEKGVMAVAGLNPHSGEHGLFGNEEVNEVAPAVDELRKEGFCVEGPIGADSVFHLALNGRYNSVLSLYHDQGQIAAKTLDFEHTISITGGMPILRTSVDHGTALDIAGTGRASAVSMTEAIRLAVKYSPGLK